MSQSCRLLAGGSRPVRLYPSIGVMTVVVSNLVSRRMNRAALFTVIS